MNKVLITGVSGFLGGHVFAKVESRFECRGTYYSANVPGVIPNWYQIDLCDLFAVFQLVSEFKPDVIIHTAANSNLDACELNPVEAQEVNVQATAHLVSAAAQVGARFIHLSTDMVFDGSDFLYKESFKPNPISVYGHTKLQSEDVVSQYANSVIVRAALIYGRKKFGGSSFSMWIEQHLCRKQKISLYADQFRSPIYVENLADILIELAQSDYTGLLHAGGTNRIDRYTFGKQLCEAGGYEASLLVPGRIADAEHAAPRPKDVSLDVSLIRTVCKTPILSTEEGLVHMFDHD